MLTMPSFKNSFIAEQFQRHYLKLIRSNISNTWLKKTAPRFFNPLLSVWISNEALFRVFDIASQSINNC